jgi:hypothetical protein
MACPLPWSTMMKLGSLITIPLLVSLSVHAAPYGYPYNAMTGQQVVSKLLKEPATEIDYIERDQTHSYVNGIKDATQGRIWCFVGTILPHELNIEVAFAVRATRSAGDLNGNAAPLVLEELRKRYPCKSKKGETS